MLFWSCFRQLLAVVAFGTMFGYTRIGVALALLGMVAALAAATSATIAQEGADPDPDRDDGPSRDVDIDIDISEADCARPGP